jgi:hypothetical protein
MFLAVSMAAAGQPLPTPRQFVQNLDVRCYKIDKPVRLRLDHLNPVFIEKGLPHERVNLDPQQLCVPVTKEDEWPDPAAFPFLQFVDWRCYGINGPPLNLPLRVDHLNPIFKAWFGWQQITVMEPQQLCVPVAKDGLIPPPDVLRLIQWLDVKCYRIHADPMAAGLIWLTHLNPLFAHLPREFTQFTGPSQLCVPVAKDLWFPPDDVRAIIEWADVLCYWLQGAPLNRDVRLTHLNPVLAWLPEETFWITDSEKLCVPVAKDKKFPPPPMSTDPTGG